MTNFNDTYAKLYWMKDCAVFSSMWQSVLSLTIKCNKYLFGVEHFPSRKKPHLIAPIFAILCNGQMHILVCCNWSMLLVSYPIQPTIICNMFGDKRQCSRMCVCVCVFCIIYTENPIDHRWKMYNSFKLIT